jgi:hypothetical protein
MALKELVGVVHHGRCLPELFRVFKDAMSRADGFPNPTDRYGIYYHALGGLGALQKTGQRFNELTTQIVSIYFATTALEIVGMAERILEHPTVTISVECIPVIRHHLRNGLECKGDLEFDLCERACRLVSIMGPAAILTLPELVDLSRKYYRYEYGDGRYRDLYGCIRKAVLSLGAAALPTLRSYTGFFARDKEMKLAAVSLVKGIV